MLVPDLKTFPIERRLEVCRELEELAKHGLLSSTTLTPRSPEGQRMVLAVWARASGTFSAVLLLAEQGYGEQVVMLSRVLFEAMIDGYWIAKFPKEAQKLAELHARQSRLLVSENHNDERLDGDPVIPIQPEDERDRAMLGKKFGTLGQRHWTMKGLPDRMRDVADLVPQTDDGELDRRYRDDNKLSNLTLHGGGTILNDRVHVHAPHHVEVNAGKTPQHMPNGLRQAYWSYGRLVRVVCRFRSPESEAGVTASMTAGWPLLQTITLPALKHAGRNGPCPCRSGRKSKECHWGI